MTIEEQVLFEEYLSNSDEYKKMVSNIHCYALDRNESWRSYRIAMGRSRF